MEELIKTALLNFISLWRNSLIEDDCFFLWKRQNIFLIWEEGIKDEVLGPNIPNMLKSIKQNNEQTIKIIMKETAEAKLIKFYFRS